MLIGDNSSGKSDILQKVMKRKSEEAVYFIDSVNRTFNADKVELVSRAFQNVILDARQVVLQRIDPFYFNLKDSFYAASCIEQIFEKYSSQVWLLCNKFLNKEIRIVQEKLEAGMVENQVLINGEKMKLSSGFQAVIRLFTEILYFCDAMSCKDYHFGFVIIDELDEYLSPKYRSEIFSFLQENFLNLNFLVTTHSLDMVECTNDADLIVLYESDYEIYTSEELKNTVQADAVFSKLFFQGRSIHVSDDSPTDEKLRQLLNLKIAGMWDNTAQEELNGIKSGQIQTHQKMLCRQIEEW